VYKRQGSTQTPIALVHATIQPGAELDLPWRPDFNAIVYALSGRGSVGAEGIAIQSGQLAVCGDGDRIVIKASQHQDARTPALDVLILGGLPIKETVAWLGPFVMNTRDEVIQAFEDYQAGKLGVIPAAHSNPHNTPTSVIESE
jgi:redox-sensitive bicupin YhaK (pirin superfamily)